MLRASCVYLPIEPRTPRQRASLVLSLSGAQAVLTTSATRSRHAWLGEYGEGIEPPLLLIDARWCDGDGDAAQGASILEARAVTMKSEAVSCRDLAYLIYTSGSTGVPKGVGCHHQGAMNTLDDVNCRYGVGSADVCMALSSLSFDLSVYDIFGLLSVGGRVVLPDATHTSPPQPSEWLSVVAREGVSVWNSVPAFVELLVGESEVMGSRLPDCLRLVLMSGDWIPLGLPPRLTSLCRSDLRVISMGGATEVAVWSVTHEIVNGCVPDGWSSVPYGVGMVGQTIDVFDERSMRRCDPWVVGMIFIGGVGVALGYVGDESQSSRSFVRDARSGEYMFRTGDLGRVRPALDASGDERLLIEILGREDAQVKLNGFRVELGEIDSVLESLPQIASAVTIVQTGAALASYIVLASDAQTHYPEITSALPKLCASKLPPYMVPRSFTVLPEVPLSPN